MAKNNWPAWLKASVAKHFYDLINSQIRLVLDTQDAPKGNVAILSLVANYDEITQNEGVARVRVVMFVKTVPHSTKRYYHEEVTGVVMDAFRSSIYVRRYNGGDGSVVGCLSRQGEVQASELKSKEEQVTTFISEYELRAEGDA